MGVLKDSALKLLKKGVGNRGRSSSDYQTSPSQSLSPDRNADSTREFDSPFVHSLTEFVVYSTDSTVISLCRSQGKKFNVETWGASTVESLRHHTRRLNSRSTMLIFYIGDETEAGEVNKAAEIAKVSPSSQCFAFLVCLWYQSHFLSAPCRPGACPRLFASCYCTG